MKANTLLDKQEGNHFTKQTQHTGNIPHLTYILANRAPSPA